MLPADTTEGAVELRYTLTAEDVLDGLTARHRSVRRPWYLRHSRLLVILAVVSIVYLSAARSGGLSRAGLLVFLVLILLTALVIVATRLAMRVPARMIQRASVRRMVRDNPAFCQPMVSTVSPAGLHVISGSGESTVRWTQYPLHVETERAFVLFASERPGGAMHVLPKRGLVEADPASLRALLASHSRRLVTPNGR